MRQRNADFSRATTGAALALLLLLLSAAACDRAAEEGGAPADPAAGDSALSTDDLHPGLLAAQEAISARDLGEARRQLESVPADDPSYLLALGNLTTVYATLGELELSLETYRKLAELKTGDPQVFLGMGWVLYRLGRLPDAEVAALRAIEIASDDAEARYNVAFFRLAQGGLPAAIEAYHRAMKLDFDMIYVSTARAHLLRLQEERPDFPDVHYALAYFANSLGNRLEEIEELERYLAMDPAGPAVEVARGRLEEARAGGTGGN